MSLLAALSLQAAGQGARGPTPVRIGVVLDGPSDFTDSLRSQFAREIVAFFGAERTVDPPSTATLRGERRHRPAIGRPRGRYRAHARLATFVTLILVPVLYAIFVEDLKIVKWERVGASH